MAQSDTQSEQPKRSLAAIDSYLHFPPWPWFNKALLVYVAGLLPVICFALSWGTTFRGEWQSGNLHDLLPPMLSGEANWPFYPLVLYATICFFIVLLDVRELKRQFLVRWGVYSGCLLALHFGVLSCIGIFSLSGWGAALMAFPMMFVIALGTGAFLTSLFAANFTLAVWALRTIGPWRFWGGAILLTGPIIVASEILEPFGGMSILNAIFLFFGVSVVFAPFWGLAAYGWFSWRLWYDTSQKYQFRLWELLIGFSWFSGYLAATRAALTVALTEYAKLPTTPPQNCYIATAAARGHRCVVNSWQLKIDEESYATVTSQLQTLKAGEIAIRLCCPIWHRRMRLVYDWLGPKLAQSMANPWLADMAYLLLKPAEWTAHIVLKLLSVNKRHIQSLYGLRPCRGPKRAA